jgi:Ca-activated chloride channel family protein
MKRTISIAFVALTLAAAPALGVGVLVPKDVQVPPLAIKYLRVDATIDNQAAKTLVEQVFQNSTDRDLEANYVFPLPGDAAVRDFAMWMNGERISGQVVEKQQAAQVYRSIVSRMRDPGLLEYLGNNLLRANVFPVPKKGTVKIQVEYSQVIPMEDGLAGYTFPLRTGDKASQTLDDFSLTVRLASKVPLKSVYSPTHKVGINRADDYHATAGMEQDKALLDRDFTLYYTVSNKDFGLNLMTYRVGDEPGYFLLLIAPRTDVEDAQVAGKAVCFVLDVSGSMQGPKIEQAKKALKYCIAKLRPKDRFSVIAFNIETNALSKTLLDGSEENQQKATAFVEGLQAEGGTDINASLAAALALKPDTVVFLTDGKPTVGETDTAKIVANVKQSAGRARVFVFGVDEQVNTVLLDQIGEATGGAREYVTPGEDIELKVSQFFNKASNPVLAHVSVELPKVETADLYPREMPDLFAGSQVLVVGRYKTVGSTTVVLRGEVDGKKKSFTYEGEFPKEAASNAFLEGLWARRKVGYLLDQIRLHGENKELTDEVVRLSQKHNIITPYTSYLVLEKAGDYKEHGITSAIQLRHERDLGVAGGQRWGPTGAGRPGAAPAPEGRATETPAPARSIDELRRGLEADRKEAVRLQSAMRGRGGARSGAGEPADMTPAEREKARIILDNLAKAQERLKLESGTDAMLLSKQLDALKRSASEGDEGSRIVQSTARTVAGRTMLPYRGFWVDADWTDALERVSVKYASDAYFALLDAEPKLKDLFKLGTQLIIVLPSQIALVIEDDGQDTLHAKEVQRLLAPAK